MDDVGKSAQALAVDQLADTGWCSRGDLIAPDLIDALAAETQEAFDAGEFQPARVGRGADRQLRPEIRSDRVRWLDADAPTASQAAYLATMESLRLDLNQSLQLGLFEFEAHLAVYPPGSFYKRHLDQTRGTPLRTVTCITYLNRDWLQEDGGQLRLYIDGGQEVDLYPIGGMTILFLSDRFEHEVLPARRDRASVTGWFRRRP